MNLAIFSYRHKHLSVSIKAVFHLNFIVLLITMIQTQSLFHLGCNQVFSDLVIFLVTLLWSRLLTKSIMTKQQHLFLFPFGYNLSWILLTICPLTFGSFLSLRPETTEDTLSVPCNRVSAVLK